MRQYEPIWNELKASKTVSITAPIYNHRRIIKAVIKEKNIDEGYKFILAERGMKAILEVDKGNKYKPQVIVFRLKFKIDYNCISVGDL